MQLRNRRIVGEIQPSETRKRETRTCSALVSRKSPAARSLFDVPSQSAGNSLHSNFIDDDDGNESDCSMSQKEGLWEGEHHKWLGCCCGRIHHRRLSVFWIQCDGACQAWYNVAPHCIGFNESEAPTISPWLCPSCSKKMTDTLQLWMDLPETVLYKILEYAADGTGKVGVLLKLSRLCKTVHHAVNKKYWEALWSIILQQQYGSTAPFMISPVSTTPTSPRTSKRVKRSLHPMEAVRMAHMGLCIQTDDAHAALVNYANSEDEPLSLTRLRTILTNRPVLVNRRSSYSGRTFLHACCAADYVNEGVVLRCIQYLMEHHGADPNLPCAGESPLANPPPLFFAISRVMPSVIKALLRGGADQDAQVTGRFRLVSNPSQTFSGTFTPLEFAHKLREEEGSQDNSLPMYYMRKLTACIQILSENHDVSL